MNSTKSKNQNNNSIDWKGLLAWVILALLLRFLVIEPRWIPSGSMLPTLQIQDKILVEKIKPKISRKLKNHLNLNSIVIFKPPTSLIDAGYDEKSALIKRVVGIPGDKLKVKNGKLIRNDLEVDEPWIKEPINYEMQELIVPPRSLWVLGDNRNNSLDSHFWGPLPERNLIGTALLRYWPLQRIGFIRFPQPIQIES